MFKISHIYVFINRFESIENNTKIYPAGLKGDVEFLSLLAVISHLANPHLKKKKKRKKEERYPPWKRLKAVSPKLLFWS